MYIVYTSKCRTGAVYTLYKIKPKLRNEFKLKRWGHYLILTCEHEDLWPMHTRSHCTNDGKVQRAQHCQGTTDISTIIIVLQLLLFCLWRTFLRQSAEAWFQALQLVTIRTVFLRVYSVQRFGPNALPGLAHETRKEIWVRSNCGF